MASLQKEGSCAFCFGCRWPRPRANSSQLLCSSTTRPKSSREEGLNPSEEDDETTIQRRTDHWYLEAKEGGLTVAEVCRQHNVSEASFYAWKSKFGGMSVSDAQKLRALEAENAKLKRVVADLTLDKLALQDVIAKKA